MPPSSGWPDKSVPVSHFYLLIQCILFFYFSINKLGLSLSLLPFTCDSRAL
jgi:hypothetical protein